ncbi:hypothetical protein SAMN04487857_1197 [Pseudomonas sp. ok272]|uniref:hypothetical protein n=1 Tax=unclassified Pseudomonas TaxID=196821 RepID=UPI0008D5423E|nr:MULTISPECIES: hypothetical protein [unclassified Pseudomonas]SEN49520.1 hypothetical protein SAMN04487857_1197 [Pseudomonas sp. ok272]SFN30284.1 hypothetical protein SAMN04487858_11859 [Pseudomonas sp. ok602]
MSAAPTGIKGRCAHCQYTLVLKPWQLNAMAINEPFACHHCHKALQLSCPTQIRRFKSLDTLTLLRASMRVMVAAALLVALVMEWVGMLSVIEQLNFSLVAVFIYFVVMRYARHRQLVTLVLQAAKAGAD